MASDMKDVRDGWVTGGEVRIKFVACRQSRWLAPATKLIYRPPEAAMRHGTHARYVSGISRHGVLLRALQHEFHGPSL